MAARGTRWGLRAVLVIAFRAEAMFCASAVRGPMTGVKGRLATTIVQRYRERFWARAN